MLTSLIDCFTAPKRSPTWKNPQWRKGEREKMVMDEVRVLAFDFDYLSDRSVLFHGFNSADASVF